LKKYRGVAKSSYLLANEYALNSCLEELIPIEGISFVEARLFLIRYDLYQKENYLDKVFSKKEIILMISPKSLNYF
jgi:hypothetical protein